MSNYKSTNMGFGINVGDAIESAQNLAAENISMAAEQPAAAAAEPPKAEVPPTAEQPAPEAPAPEAPAAEAPKPDAPAAPAAEAPKPAEEKKEEKPDYDAIIKKGGFTEDQLNAIIAAAQREVSKANESSLNWKTIAWIGGGIAVGVVAALGVSALCSGSDAE